MIKKIFYSLLTISSFFFITDNVFAVNLDSLRESYNNTKMTGCVDISSGETSKCPSNFDSEDNPITSRTFRDILDILELSYPYFLDINYYTFDKNKDISNTQYFIYLFSSPNMKLSWNTYFGSYSDSTIYSRRNYLFRPTSNSADNCFIFEYTEPTTNPYGYMKMYYNSSCFANKDTSFDVQLPTWGTCTAFNDYSSCSNFSTNFLIKVSNFDLYDLSDNIVQKGNVKDDITVPDEDINKEQLNTSKGIWGTIKDIFKSIVELPTKIIDGISSIISSLLNGIIDGLKTLFIPSDDFLNNWFTSVREGFEKQLGFLAYPITWILEILNRFLTLNDTGSYVISWSAIKVPNFDKNIIEAGSFDLATLLQNSTIKSFHDIYFVVIDSLFLLAFFNLCMNAYNRCFGGDIDNYEYVSVDEGYNIDPQTGEVKSQWTKTRTSSRRKKV